MIRVWVVWGLGLRASTNISCFCSGAVDSLLATPTGRHPMLEIPMVAFLSWRSTLETRQA